MENLKFLLGLILLLLCLVGCFAVVKDAADCEESGGHYARDLGGFYHCYEGERK